MASIAPALRPRCECAVSSRHELFAGYVGLAMWIGL